MEQYSWLLKYWEKNYSELVLRNYYKMAKF